jgi:hypothetical protein
MTPLALDACGGAAKAASVEFYRSKGLAAIPSRGALSANTVAGTLSSWDEALRISKNFGGKLPLSRLVEDAAWYGENGFPVTATQEELTRTKLPELKDSPNFNTTFLLDGKVPKHSVVERRISSKLRQSDRHNDEPRGIAKADGRGGKSRYQLHLKAVAQITNGSRADEVIQLSQQLSSMITSVKPSISTGLQNCQACRDRTSITCSPLHRSRPRGLW